MDWSKVKNILIVIFAILNLFLFANIIIVRIDNGVSKTTLDNAREALTNRGIRIGCEIPGGNIKNVMINYDYIGTNDTKLARVFFNNEEIPDNINEIKSFSKGSKSLKINQDSSIEFEDLEASKNGTDFDEGKVTRLIKEMLSKSDVPFRSYVLDYFNKFEDGSIEASYIEKYQGFLIFDNYVKICVQKSGIINIKINYRKVKNIVEDKTEEVKIKPAYQLLLSNYIKGMDVSITGIDIGFKGDSDDADRMLVQKRPVWRIKLSDKGVDYFNAYTGERIQ